MGPEKCRVCDEAFSKYKCPSCLAPYCSLGCFKRHKEVPCARPPSPEKKTSPVSESHLDWPWRVDTPGCVVQKALLGSLASSSDIREALYDKGLRELIKKIDSSADAEGISLPPRPIATYHNPAYELDKAMERDDCRIFSEKILSVVAQDKEA